MPYLVQKLGAEGSSSYGRLQTFFSAVQFVGGLLSGTARALDLRRTALHRPHCTHTARSCIATQRDLHTGIAAFGRRRSPLALHPPVYAPCLFVCEAILEGVQAED